MTPLRDTASHEPMRLAGYSPDRLQFCRITARGHRRGRYYVVHRWSVLVVGDYGTLAARRAVWLRFPNWTQRTVSPRPVLYYTDELRRVYT